ncbi:MAG TPA: L,D-transpeptidase family protein [Actinomycetota bacterium]
MRGQHRARRLGRATTIFLVILALLIAGVAGTAFAAYRYDQARAGRILPGITIEGVPVGEMTRAQALKAVSAKIQETLSSHITVQAAGKDWDRTLADLGLAADVESPVDQALRLSASYSWLSRTYRRIADKPIFRSFDVSYTLGQDPLQQFVDQVGEALAVAPRNASYGLAGGKIQKTHAKSGRALRPKLSLELLRDAIINRLPAVELPVRTVRPKVTNQKVGKAIIVNLSSNTLTLLDSFKSVKTYGVATAMRGYLTPPGSWHVIAKVMNPTWHNPAPDTWGKGEPLVIPPGPNNPLGTRALYLDAPGIRIHGTPADYSIGTYASHGCIRMHIPQSEALYPLVPVGTPVFIIGAPPWGITRNPGTAGT